MEILRVIDKSWKVDCVLEYSTTSNVFYNLYPFAFISCLFRSPVLFLTTLLSLFFSPVNIVLRFQLLVGHSLFPLPVVTDVTLYWALSILLALITFVLVYVLFSSLKL
uniref:Uncharacterized protein n=1 Tax=Cacopsylla melanoneura TaxID=428564 RepID=A0A8D9FGI2_9HEMI